MIRKVHDGIIHYTNPNLTVWSFRGKLFYNNQIGNTWQTVNLPFCSKAAFFLQSRILRRLSRYYIYHVIPAFGKWAVFGLKRFFLYDEKQNKIIFESDIIGSRPLSVCVNPNGLYYGEYINNKERRPVNLWLYSTKSNIWEKVWSFENIRHIHGVHYDHYERYVWITTGDNDNESAIWRTNDDFNSIMKIKGGSQQYRTIKLLFSRDAVYFGSDAPNEENYLYRLNRDDNEITKLKKVGGSVFYGCKLNDWLFFSTVVEPSKVNNSKFSEVWASPDGNYWRCIMRFKKDSWNKRYFQYGQVLFPEGPGDGKNLWITPFATKHDQAILKIKIEDIEKLYNQNNCLSFI